MVPAAEEDEVVELGLTAVSPVLHVMGVGELEMAAREAATTVPMLESTA